MIVTLSPRADQDVESIVQRLEQEQSGYGSRFTTDFIKAVDAIRSLPDLHSIVQDVQCDIVFREFHMKRFQYRVIYHRVDENLIEIVTMVHARAEPGKWLID